MSFRRDFGLKVGRKKRSGRFQSMGNLLVFPTLSTAFLEKFPGRLTTFLRVVVQAARPHGEEASRLHHGWRFRRNKSVALDLRGQAAIMPAGPASRRARG